MKCNRIHRKIFLCLLPLLIHSPGTTDEILAQDIMDIATPTIFNHNRKTYNASTQNWSITQDQDEIMWFGNSGEVLWFDGNEWGHVPIPNGSIVRSLATLHDNAILAGAFSEIGEIKKNSVGSYHFESWLNRIPEKERDFADIWKIHEINNTVYFISFQKILKFRNGEFQGSILPEKLFGFAYQSNGRLYIQDHGVGLKLLVDDKLTLVEKGSFFNGKEIWFVGHYRGRLFVATQREGAFVFENGKWNQWDSEANQMIIENSLFSSIQRNDGSFLFGTVNGGLIISDAEGQVVNIINKKRGLQNNTVLSMYLDSKENLWLGLDRGIDYVRINYPFTSLSREDGFGTGYASIKYKDKLYLGTNDGIYSWSQKDKDFTLLKNSNGQVWSFHIFDDILYCGHNNGIYIVNDTEAKLLFDQEGAWKIEKIPGEEDLYLVGNYNGLSLLKLGNSPEIKRIEGFSESAKVLEFDSEGNLWTSHGYKGVYRIKFTDDYSATDIVMSFGPKQGLPSINHNEVFKYNEKIIIAAQDGFYQYNDIIGLMQPYQSWNQILPLNHPVSKVIKDEWGRLNFFCDSKLIWAVIDQDSLSYIDSTSFLPLKGDFFYSFENINYISKDKAVIGTIDGFSIYNRDVQLSFESKLPIYIKNVNSFKGRGGNLQRIPTRIEDNKTIVPYGQNNLQIDLSIPVFHNLKDIRLDYSMNGIKQENSYSANMIFFQNLKDGSYKLEIQAKDITFNQTSELIELLIVVLPPWYKRWYALFSYLTISIIMAYTAIKVYRRKLEIVKKREQIAQTRKMYQEQEALKKQAEKAEKELIIMRNDKLRSENRLKAEEIANSTMELVHKNKMLLDVRETLTHIQKEKDIDVRNSRIKSMLKKIDRDLNNEENWRIFEKNFDEVHENFLNRIREKHPSLTSKDLRLCAYLRMNLSSKEIAPLLRISARSVEISRYRLRKKMDLDHDINLSDYILTI